MLIGHERESLINSLVQNDGFCHETHFPLNLPEPQTYIYLTKIV